MIAFKGTEALTNPHYRQRAHSPTGIILAVWSKRSGRDSRLVERLGELFSVSTACIRSSRGRYSESYYIPGEPDAFDSCLCYVDDVSLSASIHPLLHRNYLGRDVGKNLRGLAGRLAKDPEIVQSFGAPLAYLHHNSSRNSFLAANDVFGLGRLYYYEGEDVTVLSSNLTAAALALDRPPEQDDDYWAGYYTTGGGLGERTYVAGVKLCPPGTIVRVVDGDLRMKDTNSIASTLLEQRTSPPPLNSAIDATTQHIELVRPFLREPVELKLSGGVDSRFVAAVALRANVDIDAVTYTPPNLESEIASSLHSLSNIAFAWREVTANPGTVRQDSGEPQDLEETSEDIISRAEGWFRYFGGDHWSTLVRSNAPQRQLVPGTLRLTGSHGDISRAHYYTADEAQRGDSSAAIRRHLATFRKYRTILSPAIRAEGAAQVEEILFNSLVDGFDGFYSLDYAFLFNRVRRQFPPVVASAVTPMLSSELLSATFWDSPTDKVSASSVRRMTESLIPTWRNVPYYHEVARNLDPLSTNKVTMQSTYWEEEKAGFFCALEESLAATELSGITMDSAVREVEKLPEGRNRTNQTFEFVFWHYSAVRALLNVRRIREKFPVS